MSHTQYTIEETDISNLHARLLSISLSKDDKDWLSVLHTHPFTELFFVVKGKGTFLFKDCSYSIEPGDLVMIPPYVEHTEKSSELSRLEYYVVGVDGVSFLDGETSAGPQVFHDFNDCSITSGLFSQMLYEARHHTLGSNSICQKFLEILILRITRKYQLIPVSSSSAKMSKECAQIKEFLDSNYAEHITLDTLTALTHMNKYYLAHSFTKFAGMSPIQYLNSKRLNTACLLLKGTDHSISDIAVSTGFSSQSYFTQIFKKNLGLTPIQYRKEESQK